MAEHPSPCHVSSLFGWCSLEISTEQPPLKLSLYKETFGRRQKVNSLFWLKLLVLRKAQPAAHSGGEGPVSPWDTPPKPVPCSGLLCCFRSDGGQLLVLPPLPSPITAVKKQNSEPLAKAFQLWPAATVHFHWQIPCYFLDEVATIFSVIQITFRLISLLFLPPFCPRGWSVLLASVSLPSHCCIQGEGIAFAVFHHYVLLVCFQ